MRYVSSKRLIGTVHDLIMAMASLPIAFLLRTGQLPEFSGSFLILYGVLAVAVMVGFAGFGLNQGSWRYASIEDMLAIVQSAVFATLAIFVAAFMLNRLDGMPRSVFVLQTGTMILLMAGPRVLFRAYKQRHNRLRAADAGTRAQSVLIYGFCDEAANFIRAMQRRRDAQYMIHGVVDHTGRNAGRQLHNVPVIGGVDRIESFVVQARLGPRPPTMLIVALPEIDQAHMGQLVAAASDAGLTVYRLPSLTDLQAYSDTDSSTPQPLRLEDLLGRPRVDLNMSLVAEMVRGKNVLVTGAGGSIGSELVRQLATFSPRRMSLIDNSEFLLYSIHRDISDSFPSLDISPILCDVRDVSKVNAVVKGERPAIIFHAAALKHVPLVESNVLEAIKTNVLGTRHLADAALANECEAFVMISTDKAVNPTNVMGATKRCAEAYCQNLDRGSLTTRFVTVRFGNVLGSAGSVVPLFSAQIAKGGPLTVTHPDIERYFMTIPEAVRLVLSAAANDSGRSTSRGKIFVLEMGKPVKIVDLARRMIQLSGKRPDIDIEIKFTGLRPGEKLFEEIFQAGEYPEGTKEQWLLIAAPRVVEAKLLADALSRIGAAIGRNDEATALDALRSIVPEFNREGHAPAVETAPPTPSAELISLASVAPRDRPRQI